MAQLDTLSVSPSPSFRRCASRCICSSTSYPTGGRVAYRDSILRVLDPRQAIDYLLST